MPKGQYDRSISKEERARQKELLKKEGKTAKANGKVTKSATKTAAVATRKKPGPKPGSKRHKIEKVAVEGKGILHHRGSPNEQMLYELKAHANFLSPFTVSDNSVVKGKAQGQLVKVLERIDDLFTGTFLEEKIEQHVDLVPAPATKKQAAQQAPPPPVPYDARTADQYARNGGTAPAPQ